MPIGTTRRCHKKSASTEPRNEYACPQACLYSEWHEKNHSECESLRRHFSASVTEYSRPRVKTSHNTSSVAVEQQQMGAARRQPTLVLSARVYGECIMVDRGESRAGHAKTARDVLNQN